MTFRGEVSERLTKRKMRIKHLSATTGIAESTLYRKLADPGKMTLAEFARVSAAVGLNQYQRGELIELVVNEIGGKR